MPYTPTCAASCSAEVLAAIGATDCANSSNLEIAEINELYLSDPSGTVGQATSRMATYTPFGSNSDAIATWRALVNATTAGALRLVYGRGEKPEPEEVQITLRKGKTVSIGTTHRMVYTIDVIDQATYQFLLKLQACKGKFHAWYATDTYLYGGQDGVIADIEKVTFDFSGGRGENVKARITLSWNWANEPERDPKTW
jgi:hypothetical protein